MLNESKGNMYPWVTHTWNVVKGKCPHDCLYCYMKRFPQAEIRFDNKELRTGLGSGNTIFVGSSCDMWAADVPTSWITEILRYCHQFDNTYLFQTKNPKRFGGWYFPVKTILGITLESNRCSNISQAPCPAFRYTPFATLNHRKMVSIEPIMDFDVDEMTEWIKQISPDFVSVGADSGSNHLPEPSSDKIEMLISRLRNITEVKLKDNLKRLS